MRVQANNRQLQKLDSVHSNLSNGNAQTALVVQPTDAGSQNSSFAGGHPDQNYNSFSDAEDLDKIEEIKRSDSHKSGGPPASLPDMWNQTEAKRGDGYFIFGAPPKTSGGAQQQVPVSKLTNADLSQRLRRQTQVQCSESIINWTCPFISSGTAYDSGLIFSRGKGNKMHVYN